ncbi:aromatic acid/H+ symport family MFS transporter [Caballeronia novacaledonica]|uniref:MFS transporter n=1 Tax=Caballeronia novacaledonica TaxID=1544861 RepID=UPI001EE393EC|nr:aromatic acid/H+ symport family MFS transporter [Caballeronia novacaledonica]GJH14514.1 aromatic acid/H+ symport family MFS transporter [Caballeronia novacaledonica]
MDANELRREPVNVRDIIDEARVSRFQIMIGLLCFLIVALDGFDIAIIGFIAPHVRSDWNLSVMALGPLFSAGLLGLMLGAFLSGPLADRIGRRGVLILSVAWFGAACLASAAAPDIVWLVALRFLTGFGLGGAMPNAITLTSEFSPERRRGTLLTLMFCGFSLGSALGGVVTAYLVAEFGWRGVLIIGGLLPLMLVPVLWLALPESVRFLALGKGNEMRIAAILKRVAPDRAAAEQRYFASDERARASPVRRLFDPDYRRGTLLLWLAFFMSLLLLYMLINWLPILGARSGLSLKQASVFAGLLQGGGVLGAIVLGVMIDRFDAYKVVSAAYLIGAAAVASLAVAGSAWWLAACIFLTGFCVSGSQVCANVIASGFYPTSSRATGVAWALGVGRIGAIAGSFGGALMLSAGWSNAALYLILAVPATLSGAGIFFAGARRARITAASSGADAALDMPGTEMGS